jgi:hypothetical protein
VPDVPEVVEVDDEAHPSFAALACDGVFDLETVVVAVIAARDAARADGAPHLTVGYQGAVAHATDVLVQLTRAHEALDPTTGAPVCLGPVSAANFLASEDGRVWTLGWGHPWRGEQRAHLLADAPASFLAPECAFGVPPSPGSDLTAASLYFHSFHRLREQPPAVSAALAGAPVAPALAERVVALILNAHAQRPQERSFARFLAPSSRAPRSRERRLARLSRSARATSRRARSASSRRARRSSSRRRSTCRAAPSGRRR